MVLLDDPLSAVDTHVGDTLFFNGIKGYLRNRGATVVLVTHQTHYLPYCDQVIVLDEGRVKATGSYSELTYSGISFGSPTESKAGNVVTSNTSEDDSSSAGTGRGRATSKANSDIGDSGKVDKGGDDGDKLIVDEERSVGI